MEAVDHQDEDPIETLHDQIPGDFVLDLDPMLEAFFVHPESIALGSVRYVEKISNQSQIQTGAGDLSVAEGILVDVLQ